jgi:hypothetical protein
MVLAALRFSKYNLVSLEVVSVNTGRTRTHKHGFKNRTGERAGKGSGSRTSGPTGVGPVVEPVTS